jgi:hypothetical protein
MKPAILVVMKPIDLGLVQARRKKIEAEIDNEQQRHQHALGALEDELEELLIAERVFSKLTGAGAAQQKKPETHTSGKPDGLPAVAEMIKEALAHAVSVGASGLKPAGLLSYIRGKYWPTAESKDVGPIAWRMWQNDQLEHFNTGEYALPDAEVAKIRAEIAKAAAKALSPKPGEFDLTGKLNP